MSSKDKNISNHSNMQAASEFFLRQSFLQIDEEMVYQIAGQVFPKLATNIKLTEEDRIVLDQSQAPIEFVEFLRFDGEVLSSSCLESS